MTVDVAFIRQTRSFVYTSVRDIYSCFSVHHSRKTSYFSHGWIERVFLYFSYRTFFHRTNLKRVSQERFRVCIRGKNPKAMRNLKRFCNIPYFVQSVVPVQFSSIVIKKNTSFLFLNQQQQRHPFHPLNIQKIACFLVAKLQRRRFFYPFYQTKQFFINITFKQ